MNLALITQFSWDYRFGFNALVNGLDYYENHLDVHCLYDDKSVPNDYLTQVSKSFPFKVVFYPLTDFLTKYPPYMTLPRWYFEYYKFKLALELSTSYDALMITDCDYLVLSNIDSFLEAVIGTKLLMIANNPQWTLHYNEANTEEYIRIATSEHNFFPVMSSPFICDGKQSVELFNDVWEMGKVQLEHLNSLTRVILLQNRTTDVVLLEGTLWCDPEYRYFLERTIIQDKRYICTPHDRLMMCHGRFWARDATERVIPNSILADRVRNNVTILCDEMSIINTNWKVKLT